MEERTASVGQLACRGLRGATTVETEEPHGVEAATTELLDALVQANGCELEDITAAIFTLTDDLTGRAGSNGSGVNPAGAARAHGWDAVPMLSVREQGGDGLLPRCIRVLVLWNTVLSQREIRHVYLRGAAVLRPDLSKQSLSLRRTQT